MKISEWLDKNVHSHDIATQDEVAADFKEETGFEACWPTHTVKETIKSIEERGLGGKITGDPDTIVAWGYEIAEALANKYAKFRPWKMGRGSRFQQCVDALKEAGN
jgi:hypothetical protein